MGSITGTNGNFHNKRRQHPASKKPKALTGMQARELEAAALVIHGRPDAVPAHIKAPKRKTVSRKVTARMERRDRRAQAKRIARMLQS